MCGKATVFKVLDMFNVKPTDRVGVVGIRGLSHPAIQFASKWGCQIVVFSSSEDKTKQALKFGATHSIATQGVQEFKDIAPTEH